MRIKIMAGIAAIAIAASSVMATTPAQARWHGGGIMVVAGAAPLAGFAAGAIIGGALAAQRPYYYGPGYYYAARLCRSTQAAMSPIANSGLNPMTPRSGTYLGYDGYRHPCP